MDKGLLGWIYLLNPCGCPPLSDDDPKECQQLISQSAGRTPVPAIIRVLSKQRFKPCVPQMFKEICSHLHRPGSAWDTSAWGMLAAGVQVWLPHACAPERFQFLLLSWTHAMAVASKCWEPTYIDSSLVQPFNSLIWCVYLPKLQIPLWYGRIKPASKGVAAVVILIQ